MLSTLVCWTGCLSLTTRDRTCSRGTSLRRQASLSPSVNTGHRSEGLAGSGFTNSRGLSILHPRTEDTAYHAFCLPTSSCLPREMSVHWAVWLKNPSTISKMPLAPRASETRNKGFSSNMPALNITKTPSSMLISSRRE